MTETGAPGAPQQQGIQLQPERLIQALQDKLGAAMGTITANELAVTMLQEELQVRDHRISLLLARVEVAEAQVETQQQELGELRERLDSGDSSG